MVCLGLALFTAAPADSQETCDPATTLTLTQMETNAIAACCGKSTKGARKRCLKNQMSGMNESRATLGRDIMSSMVTLLRGLRRTDCNGEVGGGDPDPDESSDDDPTRCQKFAKNVDGPGGFVHKPVSDSTGSIVDLFPSNQDPNNCVYLNKNGRKLASGFSSGRTNGFRETIRPSGGGSCSSFPKPLILRCSIDGKRVCHKIKQPCERFD